MTLGYTVGWFNSRIFQLYDSVTVVIETGNGEVTNIYTENFRTKLTSVPPSASETELSGGLQFTRRSRAM